ncbi:hypothetical protein [Bradyrhizobium elkanii]|uniref:hypothetical protein n=1 Tax=Bradyrhizobium elkanii TaxID=29448 RepID=UPI00351223B3
MSDEPDLESRVVAAIRHYRAALDVAENLEREDACIARRSGSEERGDQDGESVSRRDDDRRDDCRAQEFCLL